MTEPVDGVDALASAIGGTAGALVIGGAATIPDLGKAVLGAEYRIRELPIFPVRAALGGDAAVVPAEPGARGHKLTVLG